MEEIGNFKKLHNHPLILYQYGNSNNGDEVYCSKCRKPWHPPAFSCSDSDCSFHIHQSCIDILPQIHTPFHSHHKLPLSVVLTNTFCKCCGQKPTGKSYSCPQCDFVIDLQCLIADTKATGLTKIPGGDQFHHFTHPHPLTFLQQHWGKNRIVVCSVCQLRIKSGSDSISTYFCSQCDSHFHQQCAELSREIINLRYHQHPLFLFARSFESNILCNNCRNICFNFFYSCPPCKFNLHVSCLPSFHHQHDFIKLHKAFPYKCQICGKNSESAVPWFCSICHLFAHKSCAEQPTILHTFDHRHPLSLTFSGHCNICKICNGKINMSFARYVCRICSYDAHLNCAKSREKKEMDGILLTEEEVGVGMNKILHFSHKHELILRPGEDNRVCNGCMQLIVTEYYGCSKCRFYLHEECARFTSRYKKLLFHSHKLNMVYIPDFIFSCSVCLQYCQGFAYNCQECSYAIDIRCAAITFPFSHSSHKHHPLFHYRDKGKHKCGGCGEGLKNKFVFGCDDCNFYLDAKCANLPLAVRNRFDEHPLSLTFVNKDEEGDDEHYCDICEEKRGRNEWYYCCKMCYFAAHMKCALGDYPFLKSAKFEGHRHMLNLVKEGKKGYSACGSCGHSCEGNLAFECEHCICKFNVHAFGLCYYKLLTQGSIAFAMPSLHSRSLPLYLDPIQRKRSKIIMLLEGEGKQGGWKEREFSGIREFMVNHGRWADSILIQYEENEKSLEEEDDDEDEKDDDMEIPNVAMSLGKYGGFEGEYWDDAAFSSIQSVEITHEKAINSITIKYDQNGPSERHGGNRGCHTSTSLSENRKMTKLIIT
uniref:Phorbol-ester/DAG-type domain-containing protein n=1 Tax=Cucumis melo TaxID=3656 RepID=A0A9I9CHW5_CUCME